MHLITYEKTCYIYCGDIVKKSDDKSINYTILFMKYMYHKCGLVNLLLQDKVFLIFCYNPRSYNLASPFLKRFSAYENNLQINLLAYKQNTGDFFVLLDAWEMLLMKKTEMFDKLFNILKLEAEYEYEKEIR